MDIKSHVKKHKCAYLVIIAFIVFLFIRSRRQCDCGSCDECTGNAYENMGYLGHISNMREGLAYNSGGNYAPKYKKEKYIYRETEKTPSSANDYHNVEKFSYDFTYDTTSAPKVEFATSTSPFIGALPA